MAQVRLATANAAWQRMLAGQGCTSIGQHAASVESGIVHLCALVSAQHQAYIERQAAQAHYTTVQSQLDAAAAKRAAAIAALETQLGVPRAD